MSFENTPPLTLSTAQDLLENFHSLQSDFYILTHQFGQEQRFKDFMKQGYPGKHEWVNIEDFLYKLVANAEARLPTGRNPTQAELQNFVNAYGRFDYLCSEFTRIRKQLEGRHFPYHPEGVRYLVIGNQAHAPDDMHVSRSRAGRSQMKRQHHSAATGPPVFSDSFPREHRPALQPRDSLAGDEAQSKLKHHGDTLSAANNFPPTTYSNARTTRETKGGPARKSFASDIMISQGAAVKTGNHASRGIGYSPNEIEIGLHLMNERQHLDIIKGLQEYIEKQNEKIENLVERIRENEVAKKKMRGRQDELMQRVKELTEALASQID